MLWFVCYFPLVLRLTLFTSSRVFLFLFYPARYFQVSATSPAGGARQFVSCMFSFFFFSFDVSSLFLLFLCFLLFLYFIECVCRACRIQYDDMALHCPLLLWLLHTRYLVRGNVVSLWRSFVTAEVLSL